MSTAVKERPILFSAPMVRAILAGDKTQTRRIIKRPPNDPHHLRILGPSGAVHYTRPEGDKLVREAWQTPGYRVLTCAEWMAEQCQYGRPGDRLWVRETWGYNPDHPGMAWHACYRADPGMENDGIKWKPSIHMPRAACRIKLEITSVRVERLQDISADDAEAEGVERTNFTGFGDERGLPVFPEPDVYRGSINQDWTECPIEAYQHLWEAINGPHSWEANPWVWVVEFRRIT